MYTASCGKVAAPFGRESFRVHIHSPLSTVSLTCDTSPSPFSAAEQKWVVRGEGKRAEKERSNKTCPASSSMAGGADYTRTKLSTPPSFPEEEGGRNKSFVTIPLASRSPSSSTECGVPSTHPCQQPQRRSRSSDQKSSEKEENHLLLLFLSPLPHLLTDRQTRKKDGQRSREGGRKGESRRCSGRTMYSSSSSSSSSRSPPGKKLLGQLFVFVSLFFLPSNNSPLPFPLIFFTSRRGERKLGGKII